MKYVIDDEKLSQEFTEGQINGIMKLYSFSRLEALIYLWSFNYFITNTDEVKKDLGRMMYRNLATTFSRLFEVQDDQKS